MLSSCTLVCSACSESAEEGLGTLTLTTWGEDYIEKQIPASEVEGGASITFSRFLVALSELKVADSSGVIGGEVKEQRVFDLVPAGPHELAVFTDIGAKRWDALSVRCAPASGAVAGNASVDDVQLMNQRGLSVYVEGQLRPKTGSPLSFAWGFDVATHYERCEDADGKLGVVVPTGGSATAQLTIHGDHVFYDSLQGDAKLRVEALIAADTDANGDISMEELAAVDLTTLPIDQYDTAGDGSVATLADFVRALSRTVVHFQGEGHCVSR
ncbi:MAG: hypothetical protein CSA65_08275 [Proteobacteria bacterium]|nr:MAG: hypothetical protein CSA65_08275 [Pseudomonadota bacterium]